MPSSMHVYGAATFCQIEHSECMCPAIESVSTPVIPMIQSACCLLVITLKKFSARSTTGCDPIIFSITAALPRVEIDTGLLVDSSAWRYLKNNPPTSHTKRALSTWNGTPSNVALLILRTRDRPEYEDCKSIVRLFAKKHLRNHSKNKAPYQHGKIEKKRKLTHELRLYRSLGHALPF